jgi:hypothetical protein
MTAVLSDVSCSEITCYQTRTDIPSPSISRNFEVQLLAVSNTVFVLAKSYLEHSNAACSHHGAAPGSMANETKLSDTWTS